VPGKGAPKIATATADPTPAGAAIHVRRMVAKFAVAFLLTGALSVQFRPLRHEAWVA
jgi:hypothetical protein